jgi:hypothetical protein
MPRNKEYKILLKIKMPPRLSEKIKTTKKNINIKNAKNKLVLNSNFLFII